MQFFAFMVCLLCNPATVAEDSVNLSNLDYQANQITAASSEYEVLTLLERFWSLDAQYLVDSDLSNYLKTYKIISGSEYIRQYMNMGDDHTFYAEVIRMNRGNRDENQLAELRRDAIGHCLKVQGEFCDSDLDWALMYVYGRRGLHFDAYESVVKWGSQNVWATWQPGLISQLDYIEAYSEAVNKEHGYSMIGSFLLRALDDDILHEDSSSSYVTELQNIFLQQALKIEKVVSDALILQVYTQMLQTFELDEGDTAALRLARGRTYLRQGQVGKSELDIFTVLEGAPSEKNRWLGLENYFQLLFSTRQFQGGKALTKNLVAHGGFSGLEFWKLQQWHQVFALNSGNYSDYEKSLKQSVEFWETTDLSSIKNVYRLFYSNTLLDWYYQKMAQPDHLRVALLRRAIGHMIRYDYGKDQKRALWYVHSLRFKIAILEQDFAKAEKTAELLSFYVTSVFGDQSIQRLQALTMETVALYHQGEIEQAKEKFDESISIMAANFLDSHQCVFSQYLEEDILTTLYTPQEVFSILRPLQKSMVEGAESGSGMGFLERCRDGVSGVLRGYAIFAGRETSEPLVVDRALELTQILEYGPLNQVVDIEEGVRSAGSTGTFSLRITLRQLDERRKAYRQALLVPNNSKALGVYREEIADLHKQIANFETEQYRPGTVRASNVEFVQKIHSVAEIQTALSGNQVLLKYQFMGTDTLLVFQIGHHDVKMYRLEVDRQQLAALVQDVRITLDQPDITSLEKLRPYNLEAASELYDLIFQPIEASLKDGSVIYLVADGPLKQIPFEILPFAPLRNMELAENVKYDQVDWLLDRFEFRYLPTINSLAQVNNHTEKEPVRGLLGLGNPQESTVVDAFLHKLYSRVTSALTFQGSMGILELEELGPIPQAERQLSALGRLYKSEPTLLVGAMASEANFRKQNGYNYPAIAFATHGLLDGKYSAEPALLLASGENIEVENTEDDGILTVSEIAKLRIDANFVALSACNTSSFASADGLASLSDAFMYAGASAVMATHWSIDANATATLFDLAFGEKMGSEDSISKRLLDAKRHLLRESPDRVYSHPLFWGGVVIYGNATLH